MPYLVIDYESWANKKLTTSNMYAGFESDILQINHNLSKNSYWAFLQASCELF